MLYYNIIYIYIERESRGERSPAEHSRAAYNMRGIQLWQTASEYGRAEHVESCAGVPLQVRGFAHSWKRRVWRRPAVDAVFLRMI